MTLDELITALEKLRAEHGGWMKVYRNDSEWPDIEIDEAAYREPDKCTPLQRRGPYLPARIVIEG